MMGMEKMLASMLGVSPDEMAGMAAQITGSLLSTAEKIAQIDRKLDLLLEALNVGNERDSNTAVGNPAILIDGTSGDIIGATGTAG